MGWIKTDIKFLTQFFTQKKKGVIYGVGLFILALYISVGILTMTTTKMLSYVLDFGGWINYILKLPLQLEHRMNPLGIVFFVATLLIISIYIVVAFSQFGNKKYHTKTGTLVGFFTILGIGCASCGTIVLTSILGVVGAAGLITFLPLHGGEFQIIAFLVAGISLHILIQKSLQETCDIETIT